MNPQLSRIGYDKMRKIYMQNSHFPEQNEWGDCLRACVASLFDLEAEDVPHFGEGGPDAVEMWSRVETWLKPYRLHAWSTLYPGEMDLEEVLRSIALCNPDQYYLVGGTTNAGGDHIVVAHHDKIIHDPSRMGSGIQGPATSGYFYIITFARDFS